MIFDTIDKFVLYETCNPHFVKVTRFLKKLNGKHFPAGKLAIDDTVFASVNTYEPKSAEQCTGEAHEKYVDVQVVLEGKEMIGHCPRSLCSCGAYDEQRDYMESSGPMQFTALGPGHFMVLFPHDAHMPGVQGTGSSKQVTKMVIKVPVA